MKKIIPALLILVISSLLFGTINNEAVKSSENNPDLILKVGADKESFILGEEINLQFEIKDKNNKTFTIRSVPTVKDGDIRVCIASTDRNFKEYKGARWGFSEGGKTQKKGKSFKSQAEILWNGKPPDSQKGESFTRNRIYTDYAIMEAGIYFIKATATLFEEDAKSENDRITIESEPIQIVVNEPIGADLEVWKRIKDNGNIGCFMQNGIFGDAKPEESQKLLKEVEEIISKYPDSLLVTQLKRGMEEYRNIEALINESKQQKQNNKKTP